MIVDRKRKTGFQTFKIKGKKKYELHLLATAPDVHIKDRIISRHRQWYNIDLEYGGKLASGVGDIFGDGTPIERYEVSFAKLPDDVKEQVRVAIAYIEANGTPIENDESVFNY